MYADLRGRVQTICQEAIHKHIFPGCAVGFSLKGHREFISSGRFTYTPDSEELDASACIFDIASLTKIFISALTLRLVQERNLTLDSDIDDIIQNGVFRGVAFKHLLSHTSGLRLSLSKLKDLEPDAIWNTVLKSGPQTNPGQAFYYSNQGFLVLGRVLEMYTETRLDALLQKFICEPLSLKRTMFRPARSLQQVIPPTEIDAWRGRLIQGEVHDEIAFKLGGITGHAGLFTSLDDLITLGDSFLPSNLTTGQAVFDEALRREATTCQFPQALDDKGEPSCPFAYGWRLRHRSFTGSQCSDAAFSFVGFAGPTLLVDPVHAIVVAIANNRTFPDRSGPNRAPVHAAIVDAIIEATR